MKLATCLAPFYWSTIDPYSSLKFQIFSYTCISLFCCKQCGVLKVCRFIPTADNEDSNDS